MSQLTHPVASGYTNVDTVANPREYVERLDRVASSTFWREVKLRTYQLLEVRPNDSVLDVGCGPGEDVLALSQLVGPGGRAVGVDSSQTMIDEARRRSRESAPKAEFLHMDAQHLQLADGTFDAVRSERVLQHLEDPHQAVAELVRVLRPGGRIVVVDTDHGTLAVRGGDAGLTRRILGVRRERFRSGRVGSQLPVFFRALRLEDLTVTLLTLASTTFETPRDRAEVERYATQAVEAGAVTSAEAHAWLAQLRVSAERGEYRHAITVFLAAGRKPLHAH